MATRTKDSSNVDDRRSKHSKPPTSKAKDAASSDESPDRGREKAGTNDDVANIYGKTGGAYIPPARLRQMQAKITDKSSEAYQRIAWEALKKSIHGFINKVNVSNISDVVRQLLSENVVRGRGLLVRSLLTAQTASPTFTHVFAALVAIVNSKFPQVGELVLKRLINEFRKAFRRNQKDRCLSTARFLAHLANQKVVHELIILEMLTLLLEQTTDDSVEVAVAVLKECGALLTRLVPKGVHGVFEHLRRILNEGNCDKRISYMLEVMFQIRRDGWKDHPIVLPELDLIPEDDQITHTTSLLDQVDPEDNLNVFRFDPSYLENEEKYAQIKASFFESDSEAEGSGSDDDAAADASDSGSSEGEEDEDGERAQGATAAGTDQQVIIDQTETNLVHLRRTIYLMLQSSLSADEAGHRLLQLKIKPGEEYEVASMVLDCCAQTRSYESRYGRLAQRLCRVLLTFGSQTTSGAPKPSQEELGPGSRYKSRPKNEGTAKMDQTVTAAENIPPGSYVAEFERIFAEQYAIIHRLETAKLRNVALFFAHLLYTDSISWGVLQCVKLNERDTTSSGRIFLKHLFLELSSCMTLSNLLNRLRDETLQPFFAGLLPRDNPKDTRFAINFFTTIGLGGLTLDLREHLQNSRDSALTKKATDLESDESSSSSSSSTDSSDSSASDSEDESPKRTRKSKKAKPSKDSGSHKRKESKSKKDTPPHSRPKKRPIDTPFFNETPNSPRSNSKFPRDITNKETDKTRKRRAREWSSSSRERSPSLSPHRMRSAVHCVRNRSPPIRTIPTGSKRQGSPRSPRSDHSASPKRKHSSRARSPHRSRERERKSRGSPRGSPHSKRRSASSDDLNRRPTSRSRQQSPSPDRHRRRKARSPFTPTDSTENRTYAVRS